MRSPWRWMRCSRTATSPARRSTRQTVAARHLVRVVTRRADAVTEFGDARVWSETTRVDLRVSEIPTPRPGDSITIGDDTFVIQGEPVRDRERLIWTVDLSPA